MATSFSTTRIVTGTGSARDIGSISAGLGKRALVVTGAGSSAVRSGVLQRLMDSLRAAGVEGVLGPTVEAEPGLSTTRLMIDACDDSAAELVVALGGGSAIDVGKAAAAFAGPARGDRRVGLDDAYFGGAAVDSPGLPCIAVPTTSGTGTEVTFNSVLIDRATGAKQSIRGQALLPRVAVVDPELALSMPPNVTANTGMDALTQALESYVSLGASPVTDALALRAVALVGGSLKRAYASGADLPAREAVAYGSLLAGMALASARLGAVHGMAHAVGARLRLPHGLVCAVLLPYVLRFNQPVVAAKHAAAEAVLGLPEGGLAAFVEDLNSSMGIPRTLAEAGLVAELVPAIVAESMPSGSLKANPRKASPDDLTALLCANL